MTNSINSLAAAASGSDTAREAFIHQQEQMILKTASRASYRYITKSDDEWSVALSAFSEAIDKYDLSRGDFIPFSQMLIKRALIDYHRRENGGPQGGMQMPQGGFDQGAPQGGFGQDQQGAPQIGGMQGSPSQGNFGQDQQMGGFNQNGPMNGQQPPEKPDGEDMTPPEINEDKADMFNLFQQFLEWLKGNNAE